MEQERSYPFSGFWLKVFAILAMTIDHIGSFMILYHLGGNLGYIFRGIGRLALPLFLFLLMEGVRHTRHPYRYLARIGALYALMSVFSAVAIYGFKEPLPTNIFPDLLYISSFFLFLKEEKWKKLLSLVPFSFIVTGYAVDVYEVFSKTNVLWYPYFLRPSYGILGFLIALAFYFAPKLIAFGLKKKESDEAFQSYLSTFDGQKSLNIASCSLFAIVVILFWGFTYFTPGRELSGPMDMSFQTYCLLCIPLLYFYNGKRGYDSTPWRYFSYLYYPVHLAVLFLIFAFAF